VALISIYVSVLFFILRSHYRNIYSTFSIISRRRNLLLGSCIEGVNSVWFSNDSFSSVEGTVV
jgi:hypothetical protein